MKNGLFYLCAIILTIGVLSPACTNKGYVIKGEIGGAEGKTVYLYSGLGPFFEEKDIVDSARIAGGIFEIRGKAACPDVYMLKFFMDDLRKRMDPNYVFCPIIPLFLSEGTVIIKADLDKIPLDRIKLNLNYDYSALELSGPPDLMLFLDYARGKYIALIPEALAKESYGNIYVSKNMEARLDYVNMANAMNMDYKAFAKNFITHNSDNVVGLWAFSDNLDRFTFDEINEMCAVFSSGMKSNPLGVKVMSRAAEVAGIAVGAPFADFTLQDPDGNPVRLSDHLGKGKYVLLDFWSSTCGPCRYDIPHLKKAYELYHQDGFDVISISMDADPEMWKNALEVEEMPWLQLSELKAFDGEISKLYNFTALPTCVLVGPDGKILHRLFRGPRLDKGLVDIFGNKFGDTL